MPVLCHSRSHFRRQNRQELCHSRSHFHHRWNREASHPLVQELCHSRSHFHRQHRQELCHSRSHFHHRWNREASHPLVQEFCHSCLHMDGQPSVLFQSGQYDIGSGIPSMGKARHWHVGSWTSGSSSRGGMTGHANSGNLSQFEL